MFNVSHVHLFALLVNIVILLIFEQELIFSTKQLNALHCIYYYLYLLCYLNLRLSNKLRLLSGNKNKRPCNFSL